MELVVTGMPLPKRTTSLNELRSEIGMVFQRFTLSATTSPKPQARPMKVRFSANEADERCAGPSSGRPPRAGYKYR